MPVKLRWEPHGAMIIPTGVVTADEVHQVQQLILTPPGTLEPKYQVIDARYLEKFDFNQLEMFNISADDLALSRKFSNFKTAMITGNKEVEKTFFDHLKISWSMQPEDQLRIFNDLALAREWIGLPHPDDNMDTSSGASDQTGISLPKDPK